MSDKDGGLYIKPETVYKIMLFTKDFIDCGDSLDGEDILQAFVGMSDEIIDSKKKLLEVYSDNKR